jgi:hypothetical protein
MKRWNGRTSRFWLRQDAKRTVRVHRQRLRFRSVIGQKPTSIMAQAL